MNRLKAKKEIEKIGKLNWALEERVKSLCMENQIWRELAQTNEATNASELLVTTMAPPCHLPECRRQ
ncbi:hypothetical protein SESBI_24785 [Sesbania bispinosa]|nr:hypothetical protein SESBI_24785 [Sesbania bispinosa]